MTQVRVTKLNVLLKKKKRFIHLWGGSHVSLCAHGGQKWVLGALFYQAPSFPLRQGPLDLGLGFPS